LLHTGSTTAENVRDYRDTLTYDRPRYAEFVRRMQDRGIRLIGRGIWYLSAAHTEAEIDHAVAAARAVLGEMENPLSDPGKL